jgi:hypothetical protein
METCSECGTDYADYIISSNGYPVCHPCWTNPPMPMKIHPSTIERIRRMLDE